MKPYGQLEKASILVIGHDPRLQRSSAEAKHPFFFEYLSCPRPAYGPAASKYDLALAVWKYVEHLAGRGVALSELYVTNLCNEFLQHSPGTGTVLIPDAVADRGVEEIQRVVTAGHFQVILPMAVQTFYHLCRTGFVEGEAALVSRFLAAARPEESKARLGLYRTVGRAPFLAMPPDCGCASLAVRSPGSPWPTRARRARTGVPTRPGFSPGCWPDRRVAEEQARGATTAAGSPAGRRIARIAS